MVPGTIDALKRSRKATSPLGCGTGLISDPVDQAKSVAFSVEGNAHYQKLPDRFPPQAVITSLR
jgi:hypothetical protein